MLAFPEKSGNLNDHKRSRDEQRGLSLDPNKIYDPKYTEMKKVENLKALLNLDNQFFILNLCLGVKDKKQLK
jgi:hypothetical protein